MLMRPSDKAAGRQNPFNDVDQERGAYSAGSAATIPDAVNLRVGEAQVKYKFGDDFK